MLRLFPQGRPLALVAFFVMMFSPVCAHAELSKHPAYQLDWRIDVPVLALSLPVAASWWLHGELRAAACSPLCDAKNLWPIDRPAAGLWDSNVATASHILLGTLAAGVVGTVMLQEHSLDNSLVDLLVIVESALSASALAVLANYAVRRPRPLLYSEQAPLEDRISGRARMSFASGHSAVSFALAWSAFLTLKRLGKSRWAWGALAIGLSMATAVGVLRVAAGEHFPSDVIAGALLGTATGIGIPSLHRSGGSISAYADGDKSIIAYQGIW